MSVVGINNNTSYFKVGGMTLIKVISKFRDNSGRLKETENHSAFKFFASIYDRMVVFNF